MMKLGRRTIGAWEIRSGRTRQGWGKRRLIVMRTLLVACIIISAMAILATRIVQSAHASTSVATTNASTAEYGASDSRTLSAVKAAGWPQQKSNWCGVATISAIAHYRGKSVSQQTVANYLNSTGAISEWGTPTSNGSPPFKADIAYDVGTDPRSLAAGLTAETGQSVHQLIDMRGVWDATMHLAQDIARTRQPISVIVYHGLHSVLVSGVYATGNPVTDPASVTALVVWDPGFGISGGNIQAAQKVVVSVHDWLTNKYYWASPYNQNHYFGLDEDPDPAVGPYTYNPSKHDMAHLWIGNFVYFRPDASGSPASTVNADWPFNQDGKLIAPITGEVPSGYTGPTYPLVNKWILSDESIDAPALWTEGTYPPATTSGPVAVLAWTGIDYSHHLNVELSYNGITFTNKLILPETSAVHPSVIDVPTGGKDIVAMAWIGTDRQHSLNVVYDVYGSYQKTTFWGETTPYTPTLAWFDNQLWIAWAGTDGNRTLNVMALGPTGNQHGMKRTLWGYDAGSGPALIADTHANPNGMLLTWQNKDPNHPWFDMLTSTDGITWKAVVPSPLNQTTIYTPGILAVGTSAPNAGDIDPYYWSWIGTDRNHSINIMKSASLTNWQVPVTTLIDSTPWTAVLGYVGQDHHILMAWTGTDRLHHMNIGQLYE